MLSVHSHVFQSRVTGATKTFKTNKLNDEEM